MPRKRVQLDCFGVTDLGRKRSSNQDQLLIAQLRKSAHVAQGTVVDKPRKRFRGPVHATLLAVADGMGGMADGSKAARLVIETLARHVVSALPWVSPAALDPVAMKAALVAATVRGQRRLRRESPAASAAKAMGSTLTAAYIAWPDLFVLHVGDSRCYLLSGGELKQLTTDHSIAQRLSDEGALDAATAANSPFAHVLWNSISNAPKSELAPQTAHVKLTEGDVVLLCTDGLTRHVDDAEISAVARGAGSSQDKAAKLVARANECGGADNITVVVAQSTAGARNA
jgi:protein phosphatase